MNYVIISTGSNLGDRESNLELASSLVEDRFEIFWMGSYYYSSDIFKSNYPSFCNQVLLIGVRENLEIEQFYKSMNIIEKTFGRYHLIDKGPRRIDIDIIFWDQVRGQFGDIQIPHPGWNKRPFIYEALKKLPKEYRKHFRGVYDGF